MSAQQAWIAIPAKRADKVQWQRPLQSYVQSNYGTDVADAHRSRIMEFQQQRENIRLMKDLGDAQRQELMAYLGVLASVMMRFPISEDSVRVQFGWYDVFRQRRTTQYAPFFEQANVLFQIGAAYSALGCQQSFLVDSGLKVAAHYFQAAAGVFSALKKDIDVHPQQIDDLKGDALAMFTTLMLAQAQECFYLKASLSGMKPGLLSKVAAGAADLFEQATTMLEGGSLKSMCDGKWAVQTRLKQLMYGAMSRWQHALDMEAKKKHGEKLALMREACAMLADIEKRSLLKRQPEPLVTLFNNYKTDTAAMIAKAENEQQLCYNVSIPDVTPSADAKVLVKPTPFVNDTDAPDPFTELVPHAVQAAVAEYTEKKHSTVQPLQEAIGEQNDLLKGTLASMNLPGAIEALETPEGVPPPLLDKMNTVRREGGAAALFELFDTIEQLRNEDTKLLKEAVAVLDEEEKDDNESRAACGQRWTRTPSHTLTLSLRQEQQRFTAHVEHAQKSDAIVRSKFEEHQEQILALSGTTEQIEAMLPKRQSSAQVDREAVAELKELLTELDALVARRESLRRELADLAERDDVTAKLVMGADFASVQSAELAKYEPIAAQLRDNYAEQQRLLESITNVNARFVASKTSADGQLGREVALQKLESAYATFNELRENLREGIQFYTSFQSMLRQFKNKCADFAQARSIEKKELVAAIQATPASAPPQQATMQYGGGATHQYQQTNPNAPFGAYQQHQQQQQQWGTPSAPYVQPAMPMGQQPMPPAYGAQPPQYGQYGVQQSQPAPPPYNYHRQ